MTKFESDANYIRCNQCYKIFKEDDVVVIDEEEYCPNCNETGALMDLELPGREDISRAIETIKYHFYVTKQEGQDEDEDDYLINSAITILQDYIFN